MRQWRENYPEKVRAKKRQHYERKVWPRVPRTRQRKENKDEYDPDDILRGLFGARTRHKKQKKDEYDPDEILRGFFEVRVELTAFRRPPQSPPPPPPSSLQPSRKRLSCSSSDSETDGELSRELAEPEEPVKRRIRQIKKNRKKGEENRVRRMRKRQEEAEMITTRHGQMVSTI